MRIIILLLTLALKLSADQTQTEETTTYYEIHVPYTEGHIQAQGLFIITPDKNGDITIQGLKPIKNANKLTNDKIKAAIQKQLPEHFANHVSVASTPISFKELRAKQQVLVFGLVKNKGRTKITDSTTLQTLINTAELTPFSAINRIKLIRSGKTFLYNLKNPKHQTLKLQPGDIIHVPQKHIIGR